MTKSLKKSQFTTTAILKARAEHRTTVARTLTWSLTQSAHINLEFDKERAH